MKTLARLALLAGSCLAACAPPAVVPAQLASVPAAPATAAPRPPAAPPIGEPVLVSQRLPARTGLAALDPSGRLALVRGGDGLHAVDVETGQTRGVLGGCADQAGFAPEGHAVVVICNAQKVLRIWDLAADTTWEIALSRPPRRRPPEARGRRLRSVLGPGAVPRPAAGARPARPELLARLRAHALP
jgi:hypothetical protein